MNIQLLNEDELKDLGNPWPLKNAKEVWNLINKMPVKDFNILILGYLTNLSWKGKVGRPLPLEQLAKDILFRMSAAQRKVAYTIIEKRVDGLIARGWWNDNISELIKPENEVDINRETHRKTGFTRELLNKKKTIVDDSLTIRVKLTELTSELDKHKEWLISYIETENGYDKVSEYRYINKEQAELDFASY